MDVHTDVRMDVQTFETSFIRSKSQSQKQDFMIITTVQF